MAYIVMAFEQCDPGRAVERVDMHLQIMAYVVMALYSNAIYSYGPYTYALYMQVNIQIMAHIYMHLQMPM